MCCHTDTMGLDQPHVCELHSAAVPAGHKVRFHGKSTAEPFRCTEHNRDLKKAKLQPNPFGVPKRNQAIINHNSGIRDAIPY